MYKYISFDEEQMGRFVFFHATALWNNTYKAQKKIKYMKEGQTIWSHVRYVFKPYSMVLRGLETPNGVVENEQKISD